VSDFRLLAFALTLWMGAAITGLIALPYSLILIVLALLIATRVPGLFLVIALALVVGSLGFSLRLLTLHHSLLAKAAISHSTITMNGVVSSDPHWSKSVVVGSRVRNQNWEFLASIREMNGRTIRVPALIVSSHSFALELGSTFSGSATALPASRGRAAAILLVRGNLIVQQRAPPILGIANHIRRNFHAQSARIAGSSGALIPGLVLGDTSLEPEGFVTQMRRVGLTHLTAVSGENFAIVAAFMFWLLQWILPKRKWRIVVTAVVLLLFIFLVRPSPSVLRATVMSSVLLLSKFRGVRTNPTAALGAAIALLILIDPYQSTDPGFALSVAATAGILLLSPRLAQHLPEYLAIPVSATLFCTPLIIAISGQLSLVTIPANLAASIAVAPITIVGFVAALAPTLLDPLTHLALVILNPLSEWIVMVAHFGSAIPVLLLPKSWIGAFIALALLLIAYLRRWKFLIAATVLALLSSTLADSQWPGSDWLVVNCDVGQGDGLVINLGRSSAIVIDTGPDPLLMDSCLKSLHISTISLLVLTHFHADHISGVSGAIAHRRVDQVWITNSNQPAREYALTMGLISNFHPQIAEQGQEITFNSPSGEVDIKVLWPLHEVSNFQSLPGDGSAINNSSVALDIAIGKIRIFDGGDVEPPAQAEILASGLVRQVDILKVSHHGSAYQDWQLLDALSPTVALISVGKGNTYGHPAPSTLRELRARSITTYRTDLDGAIAVSSTLRIRTKKRARWKVSWG